MPPFKTIGCRRPGVCMPIKTRANVGLPFERFAFFPRTRRTVISRARIGR